MFSKSLILFYLVRHKSDILVLLQPFLCTRHTHAYFLRGGGLRELLYFAHTARYSERIVFKRTTIRFADWLLRSTERDKNSY